MSQGTSRRQENALPDDAELVDELLRARSARRQIPLLTSRPGGLSMERAYRLAAAKTWRRLKGANPLPMVIEGVTFTDGVAETDTTSRAA